MNQLRHFLSRGGMARQCLMCIVFTVLLVRALLSSVVMLDPDAPTGSFGLVMCSGQGPLFSRAGMTMDAMPSMSSTMVTSMAKSIPGMAMSPRTVPAASSKGASASDNQESVGNDDSGSLCAFSAAFFAVIASIAIAWLFFGMVSPTRSWALPRIVAPRCLAPFQRPRTRAPPLFI